MKEFPLLKDKQVAMLMAEASTGHVLDTNYNLAINEIQEVYTIFDSFDESFEMANSILSQKKNIELVIYDKGKNVLIYLSPASPTGYISD